MLCTESATIPSQVFHPTTLDALSSAAVAASSASRAAGSSLHSIALQPLDASNLDDNPAHLFGDPKERRLYRNREASKAHRRRKKLYMMDMELRVRMLTQQNDDLRRQVLSLKAEVRRLKRRKTSSSSDDQNLDPVNMSRTLSNSSGSHATTISMEFDKSSAYDPAQGPVSETSGTR
jgi:hypothetical protein